MKNKKVLIGLAAVIVIGVGIYAYYQHTNAPESAKKGFAEKFPKATHVSWGKESGTEWEAEFEMDGIEYSANFLEDGTWVETEHEVNEKELPEKVWNVLDKQFNGYRIDEIEYMENREGSGYEIELEKDEELLIFINSDGELISRESD